MAKGLSKLANISPQPINIEFQSSLPKMAEQPISDNNTITPIDPQIPPSQQIPVQSDLDNSQFIPQLVTGEDGRTLYMNTNVLEMTSNLSPGSNDTRFTAGIGFPSPKNKIAVSGEGFQASATLVDTVNGAALYMGGAVTSFGDLSAKASSIGIDLPAFPFSAEADLLKPVPFLKYTNTVEELWNEEARLNDGFANTGDEKSTRGIVYQVLGNKNKKGEELDFRFQDPVQNSFEMNLQNPFTLAQPGKITFKDIDLQLDFNLKNSNFAKGLKGLGDSAGDFIDGVAEAISENKLVQNAANAIGGVFSNLQGFGKQIRFPEVSLPTIDFSPVGSAVSGLMNSIGTALGGMGDVIGGIAGQVGNSIGGFTENLGNLANRVLPQLGGGLKSGLSIITQLNPIDELVLPKLNIGNPLNVNKTNYGGPVTNKLGINQPRTLFETIPLRKLSPNEALADPDNTHLSNASTPLYSEIGSKVYHGTAGSDKVTPGTDHYPNSSMGKIGAAGNEAGGDKMTMAPMLSGRTLSDAGYDAAGETNFVESEKNGMPFYIKDLRDNTYVIFRATIDGITDTISPSWSETTYIGRSEAVHTYTGAAREISMNLHLGAQTHLELDAIYSKIRRLTSLCYPEYKADVNLYNKIRMKPPLIQFRVGELFGNTTADMNGFITGITYTFPDTSPWEHRNGQRVPKLVDITLGFKVLHSETPHKNSAFHGYIGSAAIT